MALLREVWRCVLYLVTIQVMNGAPNSDALGKATFCLFVWDLELLFYILAMAQTEGYFL